MDLAVVIVVKDSWADAIECLESLLRISEPALSVIVCDNTPGGSDLERIRAWAGGTLEAAVPPGSPLRSLSFPPVPKPVQFVEYFRTEAESGGDRSRTPPLVLIRNDANLGFAGGNNVGLRYVLARGSWKYVWLLNPDTVVHPDAGRALIARMETDARAGMCGSTVLCYHEPDRIQALGGAHYWWWLGLPRHIGSGLPLAKRLPADEVERRMSFAYGASLVVSVDFLREVGLMDESYFLYFEELDWALRAAGRYRLCYAPDSIVYHREGSNLGAGQEKSRLSDEYFMRNRILIAKRFRPATLPGVYLALGMSMLRRMRRRQWGRAKLIARLMVAR